MKNKKVALILLGSATLISATAQGALSLDRTRIIFNDSEKSITLSVSNSSEKLPYLAQSWIENDKGVKIQSPFMAIPPIQRIEPKKPSQVKIEKLPVISQLPQDRESLFYFNFREIPPKSDQPNILQLSIQTKIKLFYRPESIVVTGTEINNSPWQQKLILQKKGEHFVAKNPTAYFITIVGISNTIKKEAVDGFQSFMVPPFSELNINLNPTLIGNSPILTYIDDYGGKLKMNYSCTLQVCLFNSKVEK
ncbi:TPA: fimbria/pilus periplasmic chaperone [Morganella morganii]|uniref:fimbria/pilus periplasmic chaperone n=1 Tax=Enterobacterales TaxID=91347 RepID=UPI001BDB525C|nr:fimbria/pilus periplasmic chaperone [Morganella morganii]MBT0473616.1 fimbria/pilus periplasmic chaperone [Morganella morganii subsp. morganii]UMW89876.1 hypothetical protein [Morganella morganii]HCT1400046.1 fimbria/pilus periplasmic chaperone [Morganella morganii]